MTASAVEKSANDLRRYLGATRAGRKRKAPITLAAVVPHKDQDLHHPWCTFVAAPREGCEHCERLYADYPFLSGETPARATKRYFPHDASRLEPAAPPSLILIKRGQQPADAEASEPRARSVRDIDDSTLTRGQPLADHENTTQLSEIFADAFTSLGEAQDKKVALRTQADPMGLKTGAYAKRSRTTIGDATAERLAKAKAAEKDLVTEEETFEDGRSTGLSRKRFRGILEVWRHKGTIDDATFAAAESFQRDCDLSLSASPRMIARYGHRLPAGIPDLLPQEIQVEFAARKRAAVAAVDPRLHFILAWIAEVSNSDVHPDTVAEQYWRHLSKDRRMERFKALLDYVCMILSVHYGQVNDERHRWVRMRISKAAQEVHDLLSA